MSKFKINTAVIIITLSYSSLAFGWTGNYLSFGIASGNGQYAISNFNKAGAYCWSYTQGSTDKQLNPQGHIMCNVPYAALGAFTITVSNSQSNESCTISSTQNPSQLNSKKYSSPTSYKTSNQKSSKQKQMPEDRGLYIFTSGNCSLPGVVVALTSCSYAKFHYGDWQVNLQ